MNGRGETADVRRKIINLNESFKFNLNKREGFKMLNLSHKKLEVWKK